jgi:hypothetical protein
LENPDQSGVKLTIGNSDIPPVAVESDKEYSSYTVGFVIGGPEHAFSSVKIEATYGRTHAKGEDDASIFAEAFSRATLRIDDGYAALLTIIDAIKNKYGR